MYTHNWYNRKKRGEADMVLGEKLRELRLAHHLSQEEVAKRIWTSKAVISGYELSTRSPSYTNLIRLAKLYGVTTDYLLGMTEARTVDVTGLTDEQLRILAEIAEEFKKANRKMKIPFRRRGDALPRKGMIFLFFAFDKVIGRDDRKQEGRDCFP